MPARPPRSKPPRQSQSVTRYSDSREIFTSFPSPFSDALGFPQGAEVLIPILLLRDQSTSGNTELRGDLFRHPFAALISRIVVVQTERHHLRSFHPRQNPPYRFIAGTAAGHIAVLLPVLRMQGDIGEKVDRGLKYIQVPIRPRVVKAVSRVTARHVEFEGLALTVGAALLRVTGQRRVHLFRRTRRCDISHPHRAFPPARSG